MSGASSTGLQTLASLFPWSDLPANSKVLDVGGSTGHVSSFLAAQFIHLHFIVQDLPSVMASSNFQIPSNVRARVEVQEHDFFEPQDEAKVGMVDVVLMRYIFHNWSDEYCLRILRGLRSVLKKGAKVVVQDHLLPEPGTLGLLKESVIRYVFSTVVEVKAGVE
jgi:ubiquinone/menaquinone biosynthesis C-methylase UbiE